MTQILRLTNYSRTVTIDFLQGPFRLRSGFDFSTPGQGGAFTYEPYGAQWDFGNFQPQTETFELAIKGQRATVIAAMNDLQDFLEMVRLFHDGDIAAESCWLKWVADDEEEKWSLLYGGAFKVLSQDNVTPGLGECVVSGVLSLTRHPLWEKANFESPGINAPYSTLSPATGVISTIGGHTDYANWPGNTLGRIWKADIDVITPLLAALYRGWVGIRRYNQDTTDFTPVWEVEWGTAGTDCGAAVVDATASPEQVAPGSGRRRRVTYVNLTLQPRLTITIDQVCTGAVHLGYNDQQGRYLVLLRCKVTGGTSGIQMHYGYTGNQIAEEVYVDNTNWRFIPLGNISIPPWKGQDYSLAEFYRNYRIDIYAEQLAAGDLDLDCLVLIPNEHMLTFETDTIFAGAVERYIIAKVHEDDTDTAYSRTTTAGDLLVDDAVDYTMTDWYLPPGDGVIVMAAERQTASVYTDTISMTTYSIPRWSLYRGS